MRRASRMRRSLSAPHSSCYGLSGRQWRRCRHACRSNLRPLLQRRLVSSASPAVTSLHVRCPAYADAMVEVTRFERPHRHTLHFLLLSDTMQGLNRIL